MIRKITRFIVKKFVIISTWTFMVHLGIMSVFYTYKTIYVDTGLQPDMFGSLSLVIMVVAGASFSAKVVSDSFFRDEIKIEKNKKKLLQLLSRI